MTEQLQVNGAETLKVGDKVGLVFPARGDLVVLARLVTSAISARAGFDIEDLEDLRLAVGELCLLAMQGNDSHYGDLQLEFVVASDSIDISCTLSDAAPSLSGRSPESVEAAQLSEQILAALVDEHGRDEDDDSARTWLRKRRIGFLA
jgi:serine/threonine-protein kinase RsbW